MASEPLWALVAFAVVLTIRVGTATEATAAQHVTSSPDPGTGALVSSSVVPNLSSAGAEVSPSPRPPETTHGTTNDETTGSEASTAPASSKEPLTSAKAASTGNTTAADEPSGAEDDEDDSRLTRKPGLVAIICIFLSILLIGAVVIVVKCFRAREPAFQKLDEVPMQGKAAEDSPFARFPPK